MGDVCPNKPWKPLRSSHKDFAKLTSAHTILTSAENEKSFRTRLGMFSPNLSKHFSDTGSKTAVMLKILQDRGAQIIHPFKVPIEFHPLRTIE